MSNLFPYGLFVLRHCKTEYNLAHKICGQSNTPIVDFAIDSTALSISTIQQRNIIILTSPLIRCLQTIQVLQKECSQICLDMRIDSRIIERGMGLWEGEFKADILRKFPKYCYQGHIIPWHTPPHGEPMWEFSARIDSFIRYLQILATQAPLLVCAHNQSLKLLKYKLTCNKELLKFWQACSFQNGRVVRIF